MGKPFSHYRHFYDSLDHSPESSEKVLQHARQQPRFRRCPPAVHVFTGREDILAQMREYFVGESKKQRVFVLYGLGGAGKTQIALRFVEICQDDSVPKSVLHCFPLSVTEP